MTVTRSAAAPDAQGERTHARSMEARFRERGRGNRMRISLSGTSYQHGERRFSFEALH